MLRQRRHAHLHGLCRFVMDSMRYGARHRERVQASRAFVMPQVLADVPPTAKCPKCRQRYVFQEVLELHEFGAVIRFKCVPLALLLNTSSASACIDGHCDLSDAPHPQ